MDVRQIEAFHAVITYGTTARASEVLGISQPAVSKAIMSLERSIGFRLFDREKGRLVPTAEGQTLLHGGARFPSPASPSCAAPPPVSATTARVIFASPVFRPSAQISCPMRSAVSAAAIPTIGFRSSSWPLRPSATWSPRLKSTSRSRRTRSTRRAWRPCLSPMSGRRLLCRQDIRLPRTQRSRPDLEGLPFVALAPEDTTRREAEAIFAHTALAPRRRRDRLLLDRLRPRACRRRLRHRGSGDRDRLCGTRPHPETDRTIGPFPDASAFSAQEEIQTGCAIL